MMRKGVIIVRSNEVNPDPRVEKSARWLSESYDVLVLAWNRNMIASELETKDYGTIQRFMYKAKYGSGIKNLLGLIGFNFWVFKLLFKDRKTYSYIHACDLDTVVPCLIASKLLRKKIVYDIFDYFADSRGIKGLAGKIVCFIEDTCIKNSNAIIIVDKCRYNQLPKVIPNNHAVIYNVPDLPKQGDEFIVLDNVIVYVGILQDHRFLKELIDVVSKLPNWQLKLAGFGALEEYVIERSKNYDNIEFYGTVQYDEAIKLNEKAKVMLAIYDPTLPNHKYASPNKLFESLALGKILIAAKDTSVDQIVEETNTGYVFNYENKTEFVNILREIEYLDELQVIEFSRRAKKVAKELFSPSVQKDTLLSVYHKL